MDRPTEGAPPLPRESALRPGIVVRDGVSFAIATELFPNEPITESYANGQFPELVRPLVDLVASMIAPGSKILDLGSHIGSFCLASAAMGYDVTAVEASPRNVELLRASQAANRFDRLRIVHAAVSDGPGELSFAQAGPYGHVAKAGQTDGLVRVPAMAIDDLLAQIGWDRVDFIKMDIEGSEVAGLRGLKTLLGRPDAPPIFVESNGHTLDFFGKTPRDLKATLSGFGYHLYQVEDGRLIPVKADDFQPSTIVDYLAIKAAPVPSRSWRVDVPMTEDELIRRVRQTCVSPVEVERHYIARTIGQAPVAIRNDPRVVEAVGAVCESMGWPSPARSKPWYAFWRR